MFYVGESVITYDRKCHLNRDMNVLPKKIACAKGLLSPVNFSRGGFEMLKKKLTQYKSTKMLKWKGKRESSAEKVRYHTGKRT